MNLAPPSLAGLASAHSISAAATSLVLLAVAALASSAAMRTDPVQLPCLDCYMVHQPTALDTWLQHWLPVVVVVVAVVFVAGLVVLWRTGWLRAGGQEPPQAGDRADDEEVRTGSERLGGNSDAGS